MGIAIDNPTSGPGSPYPHSLVVDPIKTTPPSALLLPVAQLSSTSTQQASKVVGVENFGPPSQTDTTNVLLMLVSVACVTFYVSYYIWKRRKRGACTVRKLEDYSYSRLSQNEIDVDNIQFNNPIHEDLEDAPAFGEPDVEEKQDIRLLHDLTPATLHVEMDTSVGKHRSNPATTNDEVSDEDLLQ